MHIVRKEDDGLLPHHAALFNTQRQVLSLANLNGMITKVKPTPTCVSHVMDLIKDDPSHLSHDLGASVQHAPQNLLDKTFGCVTGAEQSSCL